MPIKAVIFDLDGLLVDSESVNYEADEKLLAEFGVKYSPEVHQHVLGNSIVDGLIFYKNYYRLDISISELAQKRREAQLKLLPKVRLMPGALEALQAAEGQNLKTALATSGHREYAEAVLRNLGIHHHFEAIVTIDDVKKGKPDPEMFLLAAEKLGVNPSDCLVLEDALVGVQGALAAGMKVIAVPTNYAKNVSYPSKAQLARNLGEVIGLLANLVQK